jgi:hypothetical protein
VPDAFFGAPNLAVPKPSLVCFLVGAIIAFVVQSPPIVGRWPSAVIWGNWLASGVVFVGAVYAIIESLGAAE